MPTKTKLNVYQALSCDTAKRLADSDQEWRRFLETAARLYKYTYREQLLLYAQRPAAVACASYDCWKIRMGRYVRGGSKGIGLIQYTQGGKPVLHYVFDIADTGAASDSRRPFLWQYRAEHREAVAATLEQRFGIPDKDSLEKQLAHIAIKITNTYWQDFHDNITGCMTGSQMEEYDEDNIGLRFKNTAGASVFYMLLSRCGLNVAELFKDGDDFQDVREFDSVEAMAALGDAVSTLSEDVLRTIEGAVRTFERERLKAAEIQDQAAPAPVPVSPAHGLENAPPPTAEAPAAVDAKPKRAPRRRRTPAKAG